MYLKECEMTFKREASIHHLKPLKPRSFKMAPHKIVKGRQMIDPWNKTHFISPPWKWRRWLPTHNCQSCQRWRMRAWEAELELTNSPLGLQGQGDALLFCPVPFGSIWIPSGLMKLKWWLRAPTNRNKLVSKHYGEKNQHFLTKITVHFDVHLQVKD